MAEFPTVGLGIDLSGIDKGILGYGRLEKAIDNVGLAADRLGKKVTINIQGQVAAEKQLGAAVQQRAARAETAAQAEIRAARAAANEAKRLYAERIAAIRVMEQATRAAATGAIGFSKAEAEQIKTATLRMKEFAEAERSRGLAAKNAADVAIRASRQAMAEDERNARARLAAIRSMMEANKGASQAVLAQLKAEEQATKNAIANLRLKAAAMKATSNVSTGGGGGGGPVSASQLNLLNRFGGALNTVRNGLHGFRSTLFDVRTAIGLFLGSMIVKPLADFADAMTALKARAGAFTESATDVPYLMERIFQAAQNTRTPLEAIATLYTRLAPLAKQVGKSQLDLLKITETVAKGIQIGGATPEEAKSSSQQLAQALASNRLGGDELRSLAENAPILLGQVAKALNMNTGEFIKWAQKGNANTKVVLDALEKAAPAIDALFAKFPVTIGQSVTLVKNSIQNLVGQVDAITKTSRNIAGFIQQFSTFLDKPETVQAAADTIMAIGKALEFMGEGLKVAMTYLPAFAAILTVIAVRAGVAALATSALGAATVATAAAVGLAGPGAMAAAVAFRAWSAASGLLLGSFKALAAMLGGPLGIAIIASAVAWNTLNNAQNTVFESTKTLTDRSMSASSALLAAQAVAQAYDMDLTSLNSSIKTMNDLTLGTKSAAQSAAEGHDAVAEAARARAQAEIAAAGASLLVQAADARKEAGKINNSVNGLLGTGMQQGLLGVVGRFDGAVGEKSRQAATALGAQNAVALGKRDQLNGAADLLDAEGKSLIRKAANGEFKVTIPNARGIAQASADADKAKKGPKDPRDMSDERTDAINAALAQASQDELNAKLQITRDLIGRASLQKRIIGAELLERNAQVQRQIDNIADDKGLDDAKKAELTKQWEIVKKTNERVATLAIRQVDEETGIEVVRNQNDLANAQKEANIELLRSQSEAAQYAFQRRDIDKEILTAQQALEKSALQQVTIEAGATQTQVDIAQARLKVLDAIHANEQTKQDGGIQQAFDNVANALNDVASNFKSKNWAGLVNSLVESIGSIRQAFGLKGSLGGKIGAVAGVGGIVGSAVGGTAGSGLMGAAGGAAAGVALTGAAASGALGGAGAALLAAGPAGWIVGGLAIAGGILGLFGGSKAKKRQQEEERTKAASDAAALALETANQAREIEIQILTLQGDALGARNLALAAERAGIAESNLARFDELQALKDATSIRELNIQLLEAQGAAEEAQAMRREDALKALTPAEQELTRQIWAATAATEARAAGEAARAQAVVDAQQAVTDAEQALAQARDRERQSTIASVKATADAAQKTRDTFKGFVDSLSDFRRKLNTGDISGLTSTRNYRALRSQFMETSSRAALGDEDAIGRLQGVSEEFLAASKDNASESLYYLRDLAMVKQAVEAARDTSQRTTDIAQLQLDAANAQLASLETINDSVLSVAEAVAALAAAQTALANARAIQAAGPSGQVTPWSVTPRGDGMGSYAATPDPNDYGPMTPSGRTATNYLVENPDVWAAAAAAAASGQTTEAEFARQHYEQFGKAEGRQGFAMGGFHPGGLRLVGEEGPEVEATGASRIWNASQTAEMLGGGGSDAMVAQQAETNRRLEFMGQKIGLMAKDISSLETKFTTVTKGGKGMLLDEDQVDELKAG